MNLNRNTNDQGINSNDIAQLEHDILEIETDWIKKQISEDNNYKLLEDERPSRSFLNIESGKGGYSNITFLRTPNPHFDCNNPAPQVTLTNWYLKVPCVRKTEYLFLYLSEEIFFLYHLKAYY